MIEEPRSSGSVLLGFLLAVGLHGLAVVLCCAFAALFLEEVGVGLVPFLFVGVTQLVYLGPAAAFAFALKRNKTLTGILIVGGITFLLNAACFGVLLLGFTGAWQGPG
ncbi:MAG: hypothetical protein HUU28_08170 [Planctomycetaceae bacterium]|nr:hypothetical protein [Planctomycetaceae bacterium]